MKKWSVGSAVAAVVAGEVEIVAIGSVEIEPCAFVVAAGGPFPFGTIDSAVAGVAEVPSVSARLAVKIRAGVDPGAAASVAVERRHAVGREVAVAGGHFAWAMAPA